MAHYYVDSSVLVRRHALETGTTWVQMLTDPAAGNTIITSRISTVEVISAFQRKHREGGLTSFQLSQLTADFLAVCNDEYDLVDVTAGVLSQARELVQRPPRKAYDAVQLASAMLVNDALQGAGISGVMFVASDRQLLNAGVAEAFAVDNPMFHP